MLWNGQGVDRPSPQVEAAGELGGGQVNHDFKDRVARALSSTPPLVVLEWQQKFLHRGLLLGK